MTFNKVPAISPESKEQSVPVALNGMRIDTLRLCKYLTVVAIALAIVGAIANLIIYQVAESPEADVARVMSRFDLGHEPSLPAFFSSLVLLLNGLMLLMIAWTKRRSKERGVTHWAVLGFIFVAMSIDETVMFHEMIDKAIGFAVATDGFLLFPWAVLGATVALAVFAAYAGFLLRLPRRFALLFIASGALYVGGAVGMEFLAAGVIDQHGVESAYHTLVQTIEESLEMAGSILFFYSLATYWAQFHGTTPIILTQEGRA
jgi:hypothetical protein